MIVPLVLVCGGAVGLFLMIMVASVGRVSRKGETGLIEFTTSKEREAAAHSALEAGQIRKAIEHLGWAVDGYRTDGRLEELARSAGLLARLIGREGNPARGMEILQRLCRDFRSEARGDLRARVLVQKGELMAAAGNLSLSLGYYRQAARLWGQGQLQVNGLPGIEGAVDVCVRLVDALSGHAHRCLDAADLPEARKSFKEALSTLEDPVAVAASMTVDSALLPRIRRQVLRDLSQCAEPTVEAGSHTSGASAAVSGGQYQAPWPAA